MDGQADYYFSIEKVGGEWRIYILDQPSYGSRSSSAHATHRLSDGSGRKYVCWTGSLYSEADAWQIAALWADKTQNYIRSGSGF